MAVDGNEQSNVAEVRNGLISEEKPHDGLDRNSELRDAAVAIPGLETNMAVKNNQQIGIDEVNVLLSGEKHDGGSEIRKDDVKGELMGISVPEASMAVEGSQQSVQEPNMEQDGGSEIRKDDGKDELKGISVPESSMAVEGSQQSVQEPNMVLLDGEKINDDSGVRDHGGSNEVRSISGLDTRMVVEANQQSDELKDLSVPVASTVVKVNQQIDELRKLSAPEAGMAVEVNQQKDELKDLSALEGSMPIEGRQQNGIHELDSLFVFDEKLNGDSEIPDHDSSNEAKCVSGLGISMTVEANQQSDFSDPSTILVATENAIIDSGIRNNGITDDAAGFDTSNMVPPITKEVDVADIRIDVKSNEAEDLDSSQMVSQMKGQDDAETMNDVSIDKAGNFDASKGVSSMKDEDPSLSGSPNNADEMLSAGEDSEFQTELKRGAESRERKRSKYLSPPYVNLGRGSKGLKDSENENFAVPENGMDSGRKLNSQASSSVSKSGSKKKERKWSKKSVAPSVNLQDIKASSAELLSELHISALDCLYPYENEHFDPTEIFFTLFRSSVFHDECTSRRDGESTVGQNETVLVNEATKENTAATSGLNVNNQNQQVGNSSDSKPEPKKRKRKSKTAATPTDILPAGLYDVNVSVTGSSLLTPAVVAASTDNAKPQQKRKKNEVTAEGVKVPDQTTPVSLDFGQGNRQALSSLDLSQEPKQTTLLSFEHKEVSGIPDLNGNYVNPSGLSSSYQGEGHPAPESMPGPKKRGRPKGSVLTASTSDGNPEKKKRRRRCKDGTYRDDPVTASSPILSTNIANAKPISLEVCLRNVASSSPAPTAHLNGSLAAGSMCGATNPASTLPTDGVSSAVLKPHSIPTGGPPPLAQIKKDLEVMTAMLANSGDDLTPETKVKLENEVKGLLMKLGSTPGPSSSS